MKRSFRYEATGSVAHTRISPLMPADWIDNDSTDSKDGNANTAAMEDKTPPDFLWENAARRESKDYRDTVSVYSHLPNGLNILDSKWVLGRIFNERREDDSELLATLETHCFRGPDGFQAFGDKVGLWKNQREESESARTGSNLVDILEDAVTTTDAVEPNNLWVVKDAQANGAGGIWVVGPSNATAFGKDDKKMFPDHKYVAQKYVWPPVLFGGRKCHVRVYGLLTSDGRAFVHHRAFLHVANDPFTTTSNTEQTMATGRDKEAFEESVHITNCCANSHDDSKFAGEILADFETSATTERDGQTVIPLAQYFPSVQACVAGLAKRVFPFLQGGQANHGFEYLGMDFILAHDDKTDTPLAYLLEINAPPSQDTATGLPHAENLHDDVIRDLMSLWVFPNVPNTIAVEQPGGWRCVYEDNASGEGFTAQSSGAQQHEQQLIIPSKAAIINKIRWAIFERKTAKKEQTSCNVEEPKPNEGTKGQSQMIAEFARSQFPYFLSSATDDSVEQSKERIFFENAGGSQVAQVVIDSITASLSFRHRKVVGSRTKQAARETFQRLLGARPIDPIVLGSNASSLLSSLADLYVQLGLLKENDEVVISSENHLANVQPWECAAQSVGATIRWWTPVGCAQETLSSSSSKLEDLLNANTRIVALPHASNVLGQIRDIEGLTRRIKQKTLGRAHVVVDGVAASPHVFANVNQLQADWYVVSAHKLFGPHVGGLYGRKDGAATEILEASGATSEDSASALYPLLEKGTVNYEGCAGIVGLGQYIESLACCSRKIGHGNRRNRQSLQDAGEPSQRSSTIPNILKPSLTIANATEGYTSIRIVEEPLAEALLAGLRQFPKVKIIEGNENKFESVMRLPIVSWLHADIPVDIICNLCDKSGISCRVSSFLCTQMLADGFGFDIKKGMLRVSLAHYNTLDEVHCLFECLKKIPGFV
ncbi:unnamed protein product [Cylindrotheca closterium]|uniref:Aminotransferase class V domain-containing protein n=1 Tax=Cylindrotheca closterium TaxID=2856 RepID=A0AAD2FLC0_9STRA|nr:unnamed protein product [Cylindrotheca closterium]